MSVDQEEEFWIKKRVGSRRTYGSRRGLDSEEVIDPMIVIQMHQLSMIHKKVIYRNILPILTVSLILRVIQMHQFEMIPKMVIFRNIFPILTSL